MAYAAVVSLMHNLDEIQLSARYQAIHNKDLIESLRERLCFLQEFLEDYSQKRSKEIESLESRIRDSAYVAADYVESHMLKCSLARSTAEREEISTDFCQDLLQGVEELDSIKEEVMKNIKENTVMKTREPKNSKGAASLRSDNFGNDIVVGFGEHLNETMDALTGPESSLQIFPIVGMGGIGKTTLARSVYDHGFIVERFDVRSWFAVSQEYDVREIILSILHDITISVDQKTQESDERQETGQDLESYFDLKAFIDRMMRMADYEIGDKLRKSLWGRRYFIVLDDMWRSEAWDEIMRYFPDNNNGSRIMVTTRLSNVAEHVRLGSRSPFELTFLSMDKSWELLCELVFGQKDCPQSELEEVGRMIVQNCKGLPLAIKVVAGLLSKSNRNRKSWEFIAEDMNSIINSENEEHCFKILYLSYSQLPIHLKPCFLYMGVFPEDSYISVSKLIKLWVAEGFLKSCKPKSLEEVAEEYLKDLIDRNLVLVSQRGYCGELKGCSLHDLLRDLCLKVAEKEKFFCMTRRNSTLPGSESERRLIIHQKPRNSSPQYYDALEPAFLERSLICSLKQFPLQVTPRHALLRVLNAVDNFSVQDILKLVNSRYLSFKVDQSLNMFTSSISQYPNLETLIVEVPTSQPTLLPYEIWEMPQLKHLKFSSVCLPDPTDAQIRRRSSCFLENLQTLSCVWNLRCTEEVVERIPNVRKLKLVCPDASTYGAEWSEYCLNNLAHLDKLESLKLTCVLYNKIFPGELDFPCSLRKLTLASCKFPWEDMTLIGSLPNLEVLILLNDAFYGEEWEPIEGEFLELKFLLISSTSLVYWLADSIHFPGLKKLSLQGCWKLKEIPSGIGEIQTLESISLFFCSSSAVDSANQILMDQRDAGNDSFEVSINKL